MASEPEAVLGQPRGGYTAVQMASFLFGAAFLVLGALGFVPGVTAGTDTMTWAGHHSGAELFGVFEVSILHNLVHLAYGVAGLLAARTFVRARAFFIFGGMIYLLLMIYGMVVDLGSWANVVGLNSADNWLHLGLGLGMLFVGLTLAGTHAPTTKLRVPRARRT